MEQKTDATFQRLRSKVARDNPDHSLRKTREGTDDRKALGQFWIANWRKNTVVRKNVSLAELDRKVGGHKLTIPRRQPTITIRAAAVPPERSTRKVMMACPNGHRYMTRSYMVNQAGCPLCQIRH